MKPTFHHGLVNGPFDDPCLYVRLFWQPRALLFDAGDITALDQRSIQKISDVFVTHTHIDHFIGFDTLLRTHLRNERPLKVYGPMDIIEHIEGKLRGYSWNLIEQYPIKMEVFGIGEDSMRHVSFHASEGFRRIDRGVRDFEGVVLNEELFRVRAVSLSHDIQCMGYALEEDFHINIDKVLLSEMGLPVGKWLSQLKSLIRESAHEKTAIDIEGRTYELKQLKPLAMITQGQKISYVMDTGPNEENIKKIIDLVKDSNTLYCEAYFMDEDSARAFERNHLTARLAGKIARQAGVRELVVTHFSPKYRGAERTPGHEAMDEFGEHS